MYLIVGLGNPTKEYEKTRHNMGFDCIDLLADKLGIKVSKSRFSALVGTGSVNGEKVMLAKPQTFMNLSGNAVRPLIRFYRVDPTAKLIVIYDDSDLDVGRIRIRKQGSEGNDVSCSGRRGSNRRGADRRIGELGLRDCGRSERYMAGPARSA